MRISARRVPTQVNRLFLYVHAKFLSRCSHTPLFTALPHYHPTSTSSLPLHLTTPYLNDSGGQYLDGTCDTTRTIHLGKPTSTQSEAFTRVLQGHIAIDSAIFPRGTSGRQLDVLAR